ncbi:MAG: DMT family transporter [Dongiaceae bacterium]
MIPSNPFFAPGQYFLRLNPVNRAIWWTILSGFLFCTMGALAKYIGQGLPFWQVTFSRSFSSLLVLLPFIFYYGLPQVFTTDRLKMQIWRSVNGVFSMACIFYAVIHIPLADQNAISFARPVFIVILAALFLKERVTAPRWIATLTGLAGVALLLRPHTLGSGELHPAYWIAVLGTVLAAISVTLVKELSDTENPLSIIAWFSLLTTLLLAPLGIYYWQPMTDAEWILFLSIGLVSVGAHWTMVQAYRLAPASFLAPFGYLNILFTGAFGYFIFGDIPDHFTVLGACIIIGAAYYLFKADRIAKQRAALIPLQVPGNQP